jgi:phenylacetate-CoA ligase
VQDEITVKLEVKPGLDGQATELLRRVATDLADAHEGLRFNVEAVKHGTLPRFELKAKRLKDERPQR